MKKTLREVETLYEALCRGEILDLAYLQRLVDIDIQKRKNAGRKKTSNIDRKEQKRVAQRVYRYKLDIKESFRRRDEQRTARFESKGAIVDPVVSDRDLSPTNMTSDTEKPPWC
jgi:hypothetical protein